MKPKEFAKKEHFTFEDLKNLVEFLRSPEGCSWDREQTHESIRRDLIEECYEVVEAIDADNPDMLCEELGDLLMQVVFHSRISEEQGQFDFDNVADGICKKLIYRHPHVLDFILTCGIITAKEVPFLSSSLIREIWKAIGEWSFQMLQS